MKENSSRSLRALASTLKADDAQRTNLLRTLEDRLADIEGPDITAAELSVRAIDANTVRVVAACW